MNDKLKKFQELHYGSAGSDSGKNIQQQIKAPSASAEEKAQRNREKFLQMHNSSGFAITNRGDGSDDFVKTFLRDSQNYVRESADTLGRMGWKEAADPGRLSTRAKVSENLRTRSAQVRSFLEENKGDIAPERYDMLRSYLDDFDSDAASISRSFDEGKAYYSQWDTEDDYNAYQNAQKEYERKVNLDIGSADQEIRDLEKLYEEMSDFIKNDLQGMTFNPDAYDPVEVAAAKERYGQFSEQYGDLSKLEKLINEKKRYRNQAEYIQKGVALAGAAQNGDFENYNGYISTKSDGWLDRLTSKYGLGYQDLTYEYINNQNGIRDEIESKRAAYNADSVTMGNQSEYAAKGYDLLTEDEVAVYNYYYAKEGKDKAQEYLDSIQETLNQRKASSIYAGMEGKTGLELIYGAEAGLDQFKTGMQNLFNGKDTYIAPSSAQMASAMVREDLADNGPKLPEWLGGASLGQAGYDAITTTANMAPSMLASVAANMIVPGSGAVVGTGLIGASAAGNAYQEALNEGYDKKSARAYSTLVGASEAGLQYLLGGISKLGGKVTGKALNKMLDGIDNAFARVALELGGNMISEGAEEGLQEILTPLFKSWTLKADEDVDWSEVAYSTLLGALTAGVTEGPGTVSNGIKIREQTRGLKLGEVFEDLQDDTTTGNQTGAVKEPVQKIEGLKLGAAFETEGQSGLSGGVRIETTEQVAEETIQQAERLGRMVGRQVVLYSGAEAENGYYDRGTNTIHVNVRGADPVAQIVSHELTHSVEAAEVYGQLSRVVMDRIRQTGGDLQQMRRQKAARYEQAGHPLPDQNAVDKEIVAEYVSQYLLTDEQSIAELTRQDRSLSRRILNWLDGLLAKFGNTDAQERRFLYNARNLYARALEQTQGSFDDRTAPDTAVQAGRETVSEGESQDLNDPQALMEWARGAYNRGEMSEEEFEGIVEYVMQQEELEDSPRSIGGQNEGKQYSITEIQGEKEDYGTGVLLDTDIFDGVRPRAWGGVLSNYVYQNLAGTTLTVYDENGNPEEIHLAKENDRVRKDGTLNSHKVLDKLAGYRGNPVRAQAIVHMSEVLEASRYENSTDEHTHQWMDENGWIFRKTYLQTKDGDIYEATLNIADGRDRKILYEINKVHWIDKLKTPASIPSTDIGQRSRHREHGMGGAQSEVTEVSLPDDSDSVKQYSISSAAVDKKSVAGDLRAILNRGGNVAELRQYIDQLERGGSTEQTGRNAERKDVSAEQNGAQRIIQAAKRNGISVDEYLRQNWEQYDVDGQWNEDARAALKLERRKGGRQYSVGESSSAEEQTQEDTRTAEEIREALPAKARDRLAGTERKLLSTIQNKLGVTRFTDRPGLQNVIREISDEYLRTGTVADEKMGFLFDKAYAEGIAADSEFYDQYKDLKKHLAKTAVTLSQRDKADIADFDDFRRRAFGTLRIANEGGLPVDTAYGELHSMAPELFPERITHPADQLQRMYEVGRSIQVSEKTLNEYHSREAAVFRKWAKNEFDNAVADVMADLKSVKRFADEKADAEETQKISTQEETMEAYARLKTARKTYEKARAKSLLTAQDEMQVGRLLKGEILPEHLDPERDNVKDILAVYEAKREYEDITKQLGAYKREIRGKLREEADSYLETANDWKDKRMGLAYSRETMRRNVQDIVPDEELAKQINDTYFEPVHISEAEATRFKTAYRNQVRELKLSTKVQKGNLVSEAHAVQLLGEAEDNIRVLQNVRGRMKVRDGKTLSEWQAVVEELWKQSPGLDEGKIRNAVSKFREIYDDLFRKMNEVRIRNGYEPVNYRQGYFPHFQPGDGDGILAHFGKVMGIDTQVAALPTTINGLTHTFKPGIQWFGNAQERLGFNTAYDAVEGFDKYIEGVASVIYQTDNIQRLRALATQMRYRTSDEGIKKQVDAVKANTEWQEDVKELKIKEIYEHGKYTLSNFVNELDEYTNLLANKKSKFDRWIEGKFSRRAYTIMKAWESRVGANMIAGNISSALTNFIPLTQAGAQLDAASMIKGMAATLKAYKEDDGLAGMSSFLTNRRGSDPLVKTWSQKTSEILGKPMELIDGFTADAIVRAAYYQNLKRGLSEAEAMNQADVFASNVMADRSKGAMPTLFASTNPLVKMFTQFQLEVNNQYSEIFKDLPRNLRKKGLAVLFGTLLKYFLGAFLYNEVYEFFVGRRAALDPFDILNDTVGDLTGYELPNLVEFATGEDRSFETEKIGIGEAGKNLMSTALGELPFSSGLTLFGVETDGGRIPASSAVPDLAALWDAATEEGWSAEKRWKEAQDELNKLAYVIPPFGGNQVQKIWKGVSAYIEGGCYNVDKEGKDILQYPVFNDEPQDFWSLVRASILGKSSLPEAQDWVDSGFKSLNAKQTAVYQDMAEAGVEQREAYDLIRKIQSADGADAKRTTLNNSGIAEEGRAIAFYGLVATESERELMDLLTDAGAGEGAAYQAVMAMKEADGLKGGTKKDAERRALAKSGLTEGEKMVLVGDILGTEMTTDSGKPTAYANFLTARSTGLSIDGFMELRSAGADMEDYLVFTDAGIGANDAKTLALELCRLKPEAGEEKVSSQQRCRVIVDSDLTEHQQIAALSTVMSKSELAKVETGCTFDLTPKAYVGLKDILPKYDANGNGSYTQAEVEDAIDALSKGNENVLLALVGEKDTGLHLTRKQMAALWQIQNKSWKAAKNPYDREVGQQVYDAMHSEE